MLRRIVVSDTSSFIALEKLNQLELLKLLYKEVYITEEVRSEYGKSIAEWVTVKKITDINYYTFLKKSLDNGEASSIVLASKFQISLLIIDERKGRAVAKKANLKITGVLGVLLKAKELNHILKVRPLIEKLEEEKFFISKALKLRVLDLAQKQE